MKLRVGEVWSALMKDMEEETLWLIVDQLGFVKYVMVNLETAYVIKMDCVVIDEAWDNKVVKWTRFA